MIKRLDLEGGWGVAQGFVWNDTTFVFHVIN